MYDMKSGEAQLWLIPHDAQGIDASKLYRVLSDDENRQMAAFRRPHDRHRYGVVHYAKRLILSKYTLQSPRNIEVGLLPHGKPVLVSGECHFSLSHSRGVSVLGCSRDSAMGVDIECGRRELDYLALAERFFASGEVAYLHGLGRGSSVQREFFRIWCGKEAYVKFLGQGIGYGLDKFEVVLSRGGRASISDEKQSISPDLTIVGGLEGWRDYVIACCLNRPSGVIRQAIWVDD